MMTEQEREHYEDSFGCQTEHQNAFAKARMEANIQDHTGQAAKFAAAGLFVLFAYNLLFCPYTDATLGMDQRIVFASRNEERVRQVARERFGSEGYEDCDYEHGHYIIRPH